MQEGEEGKKMYSMALLNSSGKFVMQGGRKGRNIRKGGVREKGLK